MSTQPDQTIGLLELLELSNSERLGRATDAAERAADALGRLATAAEALTTLLGSVIGVAVNEYGCRTDYVRTGRGFRPFACDDETDDAQ
jgi:hypothetical protein